MEFKIKKPINPIIIFAVIAVFYAVLGVLVGYFGQKVKTSNLKISENERLCVEYCGEYAVFKSTDTQCTCDMTKRVFNLYTK